MELVFVGTTTLPSGFEHLYYLEADDRQPLLEVHVKDTVEHQDLPILVSAPGAALSDQRDIGRSTHLVEYHGKLSVCEACVNAAVMMWIN